MGKSLLKRQRQLLTCRYDVHERSRVDYRSDRAGHGDGFLAVNVRAGSADAVAMQNLTPGGERTTENEAGSDIVENPPLDSSSVRP